ncbi:hypothetical protein DFS34DRAFT_584140 [Phlyctochytrium arcticum]|nr:hypothetical protein DFS34DRAFT_584140 [Phlyctochytrium arcticum]
MYTEVRTAATFLAKFLQSKTGQGSANAERMSIFEQALTQRLIEKFKGHWDPQRPFIGNAFRAICIFSGSVDNTIDDALTTADVLVEDLNFPSELVLWIDPHCVSYKIGDFGQVVTVWENKAALESDMVEIPLFFKNGNRTRSPTFNRSQAQTPPPISQAQQAQTPPPSHPHHYPFVKSVMVN